jgi:pyruvate kinase
MMARIVAETEHQILIDPPIRTRRVRSARLSVAETICECMAHSAEDLDLAAIAIFTETGLSGRLLSKYRPEPPIFALSPFESVINRSMLLWGTYPILCARFSDTDQLVRLAEEILVSRSYVQSGQIVGIVAGTQSRTGATNFMRLHTIGEREAKSSSKAAKVKKATQTK